MAAFYGCGKLMTRTNSFTLSVKEPAMLHAATTGHQVRDEQCCDCKFEIRQSLSRRPFNDPDLQRLSARDRVASAAGSVAIQTGRAGRGIRKLSID